jgi:hypothetical protein
MSAERQARFRRNISPPSSGSDIPSSQYLHEGFQGDGAGPNGHEIVFWFHYEDDALIIRPHGPNGLMDFLEEQNRVHQNILITMETERNGYGRQACCTSHGYTGWEPYVIKTAPVWSVSTRESF